MGRKKSSNPKKHLPSVTVRQTVIDDMARVQTLDPTFTLSEHYEFALMEYINKIESRERMTSLGKHK